VRLGRVHWAGCRRNPADSSVTYIAFINKAIFIALGYVPQTVVCGTPVSATMVCGFWGSETVSWKWGPERFNLAIECPAADERAEPRQIFVGGAVFSRESFAYNEITESSSSTNGLRRSIVSRMRSRSETLTVWLNEIRSARACRTRSCVTDMTGASDDRFLFSLAI
jgi:hypothetical protein